jgi:Xaa-Pro aminopeptidase
VGDDAREITYNADRLVSYMQDADVDAVVATSAENVRYLTGIDSVPLEMIPHTGHSSAALVMHQS